LARICFLLLIADHHRTGFMQSWNVALAIVNMGLISAIMALGVNMQWGYAGLFNVGVMGFVALGGLAAVLVSIRRWARPGPPAAPALMTLTALAGGGVIAADHLRLVAHGRKGGWGCARWRWWRLLVGRASSSTAPVFDPAATRSRRSIRPPPASRRAGPAGRAAGWPVGGLLAAGAAWADRQDGAGAALGLPRHRHARHRRSSSRC
jgi:branched-chain amino acid transport system permease protein